MTTPQTPTTTGYLVVRFNPGRQPGVRARYDEREDAERLARVLNDNAFLSGSPTRYRVFTGVGGDTYV